MNWFALLLAPLSRVFSAGVWLRNQWHDRRPGYRAPFPVVSVGNIQSGGSGKTPMAEFLIARLLLTGRKPAYLSRGYGRSTRGPIQVTALDPNRFGDEAVQVWRRFPGIPVVVAERRARGLSLLACLTPPPEVVIMDDAFQHRQVYRDLDLVLIDASRPPEEAALLPAGRLREPFSSLGRAHGFVLNKCTDPTAAAAWKAALHSFGKPVGQVTPAWKGLSDGRSATMIPIERLRGANVFAFAGIANPGFFLHQLSEAGARVLAHSVFPDHFRYRKRDLLRLSRQAARHAAHAPGLMILTTEKDFIRLQAIEEFSNWEGPPFFFPVIEFVWVEGESEIRLLIEKTLR